MRKTERRNNTSIVNNNYNNNVNIGSSECEGNSSK